MLQHIEKEMLGTLGPTVFYLDGVLGSNKYSGLTNERPKATLEAIREVANNGDFYQYVTGTGWHPVFPPPDPFNITSSVSYRTAGFYPAAQSTMMTSNGYMPLSPHNSSIVAVSGNVLPQAQPGYGQAAVVRPGGSTSSMVPYHAAVPAVQPFRNQ